MNIEFKFKVGDTVYVRADPGHVARGVVKGRYWMEDESRTGIEYRVQLPDWDDVYPEDVLFATAEEAFAQ